MATGMVQEEHKIELKEKLKGKKVLLIAPGKSSMEEREKIEAFAASEGTVSISVNFDYSGVDYIFLSNLRRFRELDVSKRNKCIITSNIPADNVYLQTKYRNLLTFEEAVKDNAGLMAIRFLMDYGVKEIYLAGFDGYTHDARENYGDSHMAFITRNAVLDAMNEGMSKVLKQYSRKIGIKFLTAQKHVVI